MKPEQLYLVLAKAIDEADEIPPCQVTDPEAWFPNMQEGASSELAVAKKLCKACPVVNECATYAIAAGEEYGVWGGLTPRERQRLRGASRGRPERRLSDSSRYLRLVS